MLLPHVAELLNILSTQKMMTRNDIFDVAIKNAETNLRSSDHISQILNSLKDKELVVRHADRGAFAITAKGKQALLEHNKNQPTINEPEPQTEPPNSEEEKQGAPDNEQSDITLNEADRPDLYSDKNKLKALITDDRIRITPKNMDVNEGTQHVNPENNSNHRNPALAAMITEALSSLNNRRPTETPIDEIVRMQLTIVDKLQQLSNQNTLAKKQDKIDLLIKMAESPFMTWEATVHLRETADYLEKMA